MRINVYMEELTNEVTVIDKQNDQGDIFYGVRMFYKSHPDLHHTSRDDDRSAITIWLEGVNDAYELAQSIQLGLAKVLQ